MNEHTNFASLIQIRRQPIGRATFSIKGVLTVAEELTADKIIALCTDFLPFARQSRLLVMAYTGEQSKSPNEAPMIDSEADRLTGVFFRRADDYRIHNGSEHPMYILADEMLSVMFPTGKVSSVTHLPYVEQLDALDTIIELGKTKFPNHIEKLHLTEWFERLIEVTEMYRAELNAPRARAVTYAQVRAALDECHERMLQIIALILGTYNDRTPEHAALRGRLLAPILAQDAAIAEYNRRRRKVVDVDPDTGLETDESTDISIEDELVST